MKIKLNFLQKIFCIMLIISFLPINNTTAVKAATIDGHDSYYTQAVINEETLSYESIVTFDERLWFASQEKKDEIPWAKVFGHGSQGKFGFLDSIKPNGSYSESNFTGDSKNFLGDKSDINDNSGLIFSFPGFKRESGKKTNPADMNRAYDVSERLVVSLNLLVKELTKEMGISIDDVNTLISTSMALRPTQYYRSSGSNNEWAYTKLNDNYQIWYALEEKVEDEREDLNSDNYDIYDFINKLPRSNDKGDLYAYLIRLNDNKVSHTAMNRLSPIIWAMPKGYVDVNTGEGFNEKYSGTLPPYAISGTKITDGSDTSYMSIFHFSYFANYKYLFDGVVSSTVDEQDSGGMITNVLYKLLSGVAYGVKKILGLEDIYDLIYNGGIRGTSVYEEGTMNSSWWNAVLKYHLIFQVIAWMLIGLAIAKILVELNFSTINPKKRMSIMDTLQKLFTVGFLLALAIPLIRLLVGTNNLIVDVFRTQAQTDMDAFHMNGSIASFFTYTAYLMILIVINAMYIMRSIMIAILSASAPFFIVTMAFSSKGQGLFGVWFKEITANIFMQSMHAFSFAFLFNVIDSGRFIERLIIFWSLIPIVDTFRSLIFQNSGAFASKQGQAVGQGFYQYAATTATNTLGGLNDGRTNRLAKKYGVNADMEASGEGGGSGGGGRKGDTSIDRAQAVRSKVADKQEAAGKGKNASYTRGVSNAMGAAATVLKPMKAAGEMGLSSNVGDGAGFRHATEAFGQGVGAVTQASHGMVGSTKDSVRDRMEETIDESRAKALDPRAYEAKANKAQKAYEDKDTFINKSKGHYYKNKDEKHRQKPSTLDGSIENTKIKNKRKAYEQKKERRERLQHGGAGRVVNSPYGPKTIMGIDGQNQFKQEENGETSFDIATTEIDKFNDAGNKDFNENYIRKQVVEEMEQNENFAEYMKSEGYSTANGSLKVHGVKRSKDRKSVIINGNLNNDLANHVKKFNNIVDSKNRGNKDSQGTPYRKVGIGEKNAEFNVQNVGNKTKESNYSNAPQTNPEDGNLI